MLIHSINNNEINHSIKFIDNFVHKPAEMLSNQKATGMQADCTVFYKFSLEKCCVQLFVWKNVIQQNINTVE